MLIRIGGQFHVDDYFVNDKNITLVTNVKPDMNILRQSKSLQVTPMVKTAKTVVIAPKTEDFLYVRNRAVSAGNVIDQGEGYAELIPLDEFHKKFEQFANKCRGANDNGDFFSHEELSNCYKTFIGKSAFVDHDNENVEKARGIILDAIYNERGKYVELLKAVDKKAYPELARAIEQGYVHDTSMGCNCGYSICSICGHEAHTEDDFCEHILNYKGTTYNGLPVWEENCDVSFFEDSFVTVGADRNAKILEKVASKQILPKRGIISKVSHHEHNLLREEQNQRTFKGRVDSFMNKLNDLPWS